MIASLKTAAVVSIAALALSACTTTGGVQSASVTSGAPLSASVLANADFNRLAEGVANDFLFSPIVGEWTAEGETPIVYVAPPRNETHNASINGADIQNRLFEVFMASGALRPTLAPDATNFEYVLRSEITSVRQYDSASNRLQYDYTYLLRLTDSQDLVVGQWSGEAAYRQ